MLLLRKPYQNEACMITRSQYTEIFIHYINKQFSDHSHLAIATRVFECIDYIAENLDEIKLHAGKDSLLRHPTNHLAFHLNGLNTPEEVVNQFTFLIAEVDACLTGLLDISDVGLRNQVISTFLNHINDSEVGCMEVRLRNAITFYGTYQSTGLLSLNDLMQELYQDVHTSITVSQLLTFFADKVELHLPVINQDQK